MASDTYPGQILMAMYLGLSADRASWNSSNARDRLIALVFWHFIPTSINCGWLWIRQWAVHRSVGLGITPTWQALGSGMTAGQDW